MRIQNLSLRLSLRLRISLSLRLSLRFLMNTSPGSCADIFWNGDM